ncbi:hypothetical protein LguiA_002043 [Lonicera macranthoides]
MLQRNCLVGQGFKLNLPSLSRILPLTRRDLNTLPCRPSGTLSDPVLERSQIAQEAASSSIRKALLKRLMKFMALARSRVARAPRAGRGPCFDHDSGGALHQPDLGSEGPFQHISGLLRGGVPNPISDMKSIEILDSEGELARIPDLVKIRAPGLEERACYYRPREVCFYEAAFEHGLRFPLDDHVRELLATMDLVPAQVSPNMRSCLIGLVLIFRAISIGSHDISIEEFISLFQPKDSGGKNKGRSKGLDRVREAISKLPKVSQPAQTVISRPISSPLENAQSWVELMNAPLEDLNFLSLEKAILERKGASEGRASSLAAKSFVGAEELGVEEYEVVIIGAKVAPEQTFKLGQTDEGTPDPSAQGSSAFFVQGYYIPPLSQKVL